MTKQSAGLTVRELRVSYGSATALSGVDLDVAAGEVVAVLGTNGAGKSTLARACAGLVPIAGGVIQLGDEDITSVPAHKVRAAGMLYLPEGRGIFPNLSVGDNLRLAGYATRRRGNNIDRAYERFPVLAERRSQRAGSLSGGEQQMLSLARALIGDPEVVIVDEPSLGLAPLMIDLVFESLAALKNQGITMIIIDQFADQALAIADSCAILRRGRVSWQGDVKAAHDVLSDEYLGRVAVEQLNAL